VGTKTTRNKKEKKAKRKKWDLGARGKEGMRGKRGGIKNSWCGSKRFPLQKVAPYEVEITWTGRKRERKGEKLR